ncbi:MAG: acetate--CoA ligase family protein [Campylobacterales bacterium]|nr:acetate--CoA ligase family protein [Campylobacterales bacterium]
MVESQLYPILKDAGFSTPRHLRFPLDAEPAIDFYPVALKIESPTIVHKSDVGGVALFLHDAPSLERARHKMLLDLQSHGIVPDPSTDALIATEMIRGEEFFVGIVDDPIFGQTILFGKGGVLLELYRDVCYIDPNAGREEIKRALRTTKISRLFEGYRGSRTDIETAVDLIEKVQRFLAAHPTIAEFDLNPLILRDGGFTVVDARIRFHDLPASEAHGRRSRSSFFDNRTVAVIGASASPDKVGYAIAKNALSFQGKLYLLNTRGGTFEGRTLHRSLEEIDDTIDTAVITIPSSHVLPTIGELIPKGVKNIVVVSAGFKEVGDTESEQKLLALARDHGLNIIGPNCLGYYNARTSLNLTFGSDAIRPGSLALIAQSGAVLSSLMDKAVQNGIGFSHILSTGNMADMDFADIVTMLDSAPECEAISIYAEGIQEGKAFLEALRRCSKPVRIYKAGKSPEARKAAFSHTGNLSGDYPMFKGLIESTGVQTVDTIEALLHPAADRYERIAIITNAGGPGTILTDYVIEKGKTLHPLSEEEIARLSRVLPTNWSHNNPIDIIGDARSDRYEAVLECIDTFEGVGLVYLLITPQMMTDTLEIVKLLERPWKKPIYPILLGGEMMEEAMTYLHKNRMGVFTTLQEASGFL